MKKKFYIFFVLTALCAISITSCRKDSDERNNQFSIADKTFEINSIEGFYNGPTASGYYYYLELLSPGITIDQYGSFSGNGNLLEICIISDNNNGLLTGNYVFQGITDNLPAFSFFNTKCLLDWQNYTVSIVDQIVSGDLYITRKDKNYEVELEAIDYSGKRVKAYYNGTVNFYNPNLTKSAPETLIK